MFKDFWVKLSVPEGYYGHKNYDVIITNEEHDRFYRTFELPFSFWTLRNYGENPPSKIWYNEDGVIHNAYRPAVIDMSGSLIFERFFLDGVEYGLNDWNKKRREQAFEKIIFSRKNKDTLKKLLYIPELFQNVYYENKKHFISLIQKL